MGANIGPEDRQLSQELIGHGSEPVDPRYACARTYSFRLRIEIRGVEWTKNEGAMSPRSAQARSATSRTRSE
jgi:hypothetical protein